MSNEDDLFVPTGDYIMQFLHETSVRAGSAWIYEKPETMEIFVTKENAACIYAACRDIRSGYSEGLSKDAMAKVKAARQKAHRFLFEEANDPNTPIERKIYLVRLTSKNQ